MVRDDRGQALEVAIAVLLLPVHGAEDAVEVDQGWGRLLVRPGVASAIEVYLLDSPKLN